MHWSIKINKENDEIIEIGYSFEKNETCDGVIFYHKKTDKLTIEKLSADEDLWAAQKACQFIWGLMEEGRLSTKVFHVRTG